MELKTLVNEYVTEATKTYKTDTIQELKTKVKSQNEEAKRVVDAVVGCVHTSTRKNDYTKIHTGTYGEDNKEKLV